MIEELRIKNLKQQVKTIADNRKLPTKALYSGRDFVTGKTLVETPSGSVFYANFLSNSIPKSILLSFDPKQKTATQKPSFKKTYGG